MAHRCYGYVVASARDVARFYWELLNPANAGRVVSAASLGHMTSWDVIDKGWGQGVRYGLGLELECASWTSGGNGGHPGRTCGSANLGSIIWGRKMSFEAAQSKQSERGVWLLRQK